MILVFILVVLIFAFLSVGCVLVFYTAAATALLFKAMGLSFIGPVFGSFAAWIMSCFGFVSAGGWFATMQSAAMGGYGAAIVASVMQAVGWVFNTIAFLLGVVAWLLGRGQSESQ